MHQFGQLSESQVLDIVLASFESLKELSDKDVPFISTFERLQEPLDLRSGEVGVTGEEHLTRSMDKLSQVQIAHFIDESNAVLHGPDDLLLDLFMWLGRNDGLRVLVDVLDHQSMRFVVLRRIETLITAKHSDNRGKSPGKGTLLVRFNSVPKLIAELRHVFEFL